MAKTYGLRTQDELCNAWSLWLFNSKHSRERDREKERLHFYLVSHTAVHPLNYQDSHLNLLNQSFILSSTLGSLTNPFNQSLRLITCALDFNKLFAQLRFNSLRAPNNLRKNLQCARFRINFSLIQDSLLTSSIIYDYWCLCHYSYMDLSSCNSARKPSLTACCCCCCVIQTKPKHVSTALRQHYITRLLQLHHKYQPHI